MMVKPLHLYAISFLAMVMVITAWFFGVYAPMGKMIEQHHHQIWQYRDQNSGMSAINASHATLVQSVKLASSAFDSYRSQGDYSNELHNGLLNLMAQADQLAITVNSFMVDTLEDKDWYTRQGVTLDLSGTYKKMVKFLLLCTDSDYLYQVKSSTLTRVSSQIFQLKAGLDVMLVK